jgi:hypothetical protein
MHLISYVSASNGRFVSLPDRPMPPGRPDVTKAAGRSVTLSWTQPDDDGGCKIGNYIVEYYRVKWGVAVVLLLVVLAQKMVAYYKLPFAVHRMLFGFQSKQCETTDTGR